MAKVSVQVPSPRDVISPVTSLTNNEKSASSGKVGLDRTNPKVAYSVVHILPGRLRLRIPRVRHDVNYAQRLQRLLEAEPLFTSVRLKRAAASVVVTYNPTVISTKVGATLTCLIQAASEAIILKQPTPEAPAQSEQLSWSFKLSALTGSLVLLGGPIGLSVPPLLLAGTIAVASLSVAGRAIAGIIQQRKPNIDFLDFMAIAITTLQGHYLAPALMLSLIEIGEHIRDRTARSTQMQTLDLLKSLGQFAWVERDGQKQQIPIEQVQRGDTVIVYPGEQVPVDGEILRGKALIDEQKLTGESMPILKKKGQAVFASTLVREGRIYILTQRVGNDTRAGQSIRLIQEAPIHDTRMENYAAKFAEKAVLPTLLMGGAVFALTRNPARAAAILTLDFATGIRVSVPTTVLAALAYAAKRGILIRSGRALEQLAQIDTIVFDKTGTLTQGEVAIVSVKSMNSSVTPLRVLQLAAAAEQRLTHPVAEAIDRYARSQAVEILPRGKWNYQLGLGVEAQIDGETVLVGSDRFVRQAEVDLNRLAAHQQPEAESFSAIYVASNGELQGRIEYRDLPRPESREVLAALVREGGVEVHMLTGDNWCTARTVAAELGIEPSNTHAEAFPEQKAAVVRQLHERGKTVAFVGDGLNDSPALAYADVSVSFAHGSEIARETADIVLMQNDLQGLLEAIAIARQAKALIGQNTAIVAVPNLTALILAVLVGINPLAATVVNNGSTVVAGVNGLRPILNPDKERKLES